MCAPSSKVPRAPGAFPEHTGSRGWPRRTCAGRAPSAPVVAPAVTPIAAPVATPVVPPVVPLVVTPVMAPVGRAPSAGTCAECSRRSTRVSPGSYRTRDRLAQTSSAML